MGPQSFDKVIGSNKYTVRQMPCTPAVAFKVKLFKLAGGSFAELVNAGTGSGKIGAAIEKLSDKISADELEILLATMSEYVDVNGKALKNVREMHFHGGNLAEMYKVLFYFIEVNFADFFDAWGNAFRKFAQ